MHVIKSLLMSLCFLFYLTTVVVQAEPDLSERLAKAEAFMDALEEERALQAYLSVLEKNAEHYEALWNASMLYATIGFRLADESSQKEYFQKAKHFAGKGLELYPDKGHPHFVMAMAKGRMADLVGVKQRIELAHEVEDHIKQAIALMPEHAPSWHLYGVWQSEVANVSRVERMAARLISRGMPDGSTEKAEEFLKKALELDAESIMIRLDLAQHYVRSNRNEDAIAVLKELLERDLPFKWKDDPDHLDTAHALLKEIS